VSEKTAISWCDATFNPWWGCTRVSPACDSCYAERDAKRFAPGRVLWGVDSERRTFGDSHWAAPLRWAKRAFVQCSTCGWRGMHTKLRHVDGDHKCPACDDNIWNSARMRVFTASMGDWLDLDAPIAEFVRLLDTIRRTPELDWLLLTKRIGNWRRRLTDALDYLGATSTPDAELIDWIQDWLDGTPPANVVMMATIVNQQEADRDLPKLLAVPARRRGLSIEPMLGAINLQRWLWECCGHLAPGDDHGVLGKEPDYCCGNPGPRDEMHWVIAGGESGPHARPMHPDWVRSLRDQCAAAGVPFHFKQWGEWIEADTGHHLRALILQGQPIGRGGMRGAFCGDARMLNVGKSAAGRLLDGIEHNAFPTP
jgi:protein gp37